LYLPSAIPDDMWEEGLSTGLINKYQRLRVAHAEESLHNLRRQLRMRMGLIRYKHVFVDGPGQNANTRARNQVSRLQDRIKRHASQYRASYDALVVVSPDGPWRQRLLELK
ncbi:hypothetical protein FA95DRAFT_1478177, partial [Auriscalpium vulgare]